jgi:hypothetical protein
MDIEFAFVVQGEDVYSPLELAMTLQTDEESLIEDALADLLIEQGKIDRADLERAQRKGRTNLCTPCCPSWAWSQNRTWLRRWPTYWIYLW